MQLSHGCTVMGWGGMAVRQRRSGCGWMWGDDIHRDASLCSMVTLSPSPTHTSPRPHTFPIGEKSPPPPITPSGDARSPLPSSPLLLPSQLPFALIPVLTFTSLPSVMNDFANGL